jgi:hypothetical protein
MTKADLRLLSIAALVTAAVAGTLAFEAALRRGQTLPFGHTRYGLIFLHSGAHYHALVPVLALVSLVIVALSGIIGQAVHALALRGLNDQRRLLQHDGLSNGEIDLRLHRLASEEKAFRLWQVIHAPMTILCVALILIHMTGAWFFAGFL